MSQQGTIKRYSLLIKKVTEEPYASFASIMTYLAAKGFEVSERTVQRDMEQLDAEFGLKIAYCRQKNGYYIAEKDFLLFDPFYRLLEVFNAAEFMLQSFSNGREMLKYVCLESSMSLRGIEHLMPIYEAMRERHPVTIDYQTFFEGPKKNFTVHPYLLKEYLNRWYLVGCFEGKSKFYLFGLDRIESLTVSKEFFVRDESLDPLRKFKDTIGVSFEGEEKQKIVLSFTRQQGNYIKSLPLHSSQRILRETESEYRIQIEVVPNFELLQKILMHGELVKVLEPAWLVEDVKTRLHDALEQYSS